MIAARHWEVPALMAAASAAAAASGGSASLQPASRQQTAPTAAAPAPACGTSPCTNFAELLEAALHAWLGLMQSLLLQPPHDLLLAAASATQQQVVSQTCKCKGASSPDSSSLQADEASCFFSCFAATCHRLHAIPGMLAWLQQLSVPEPGTPAGTSHSSRVLGRTAAPVLLLLEAFARGMLPHHMQCSRCSCRGD
jgi:hypothetical protein